MAEPLRVVVGRRVKELREDAGLRQQDLSRAVRAVGLNWMQNRIGELESGTKAVGLEDLVLLAGGLSTLLGKPITLADLIEVGAVVELSPTVSVLGVQLQELLTGRSVQVEPDPDRPIPHAVTSEDELHELDLLAGAMGMSQGMRERAAAMPVLHFSEADDRAASRLGVSRQMFGYLCENEWGRPMSQERDRRLSKQRLSELSVGRAAGLKGRVTRELLADLRVALTSARRLARTRKS